MYKRQKLAVLLVSVHTHRVSRSDLLSSEVALFSGVRAIVRSKLRIFGCLSLCFLGLLLVAGYQLARQVNQICQLPAQRLQLCITRISTERLINLR